MRHLWESPAISAKLLRGALVPLSWLYAGGWQAYLLTYRLGLKRAAEPHRPVLCVGNLQAGGSGKSPLVRHLVDVLREMGREVVVSCSGYGAPRAEAATIAPEGDLDAAEWGDEPTMLRTLIPDLPLVVGRRRVLAAELVHQRFPNAVMLMDDGFQHLPLKKSVSIVLDPLAPTNRWCLPAGPYREPRSNRSRADLVLPGQFRVVEDSPWFEDPYTTDHHSLPARFAVLCALGQPARFLAALPHPPVATKLLPDHDPLTAGTLFDGMDPALPVVVTAKDWVKLRARNDLAGRQILVAHHAVRVEPADDFRAWLAERLDG
jgi:tetraacyldisaccharide 4'-kinase